MFEQDNVDLIRDQRRQRQAPAPRFVGRQRGTPSAPAQPGYLHFEDTEDDICFACYAVGHKKPNCPHLGSGGHDAVDKNIREKNFKALRPLQKKWLADVGRLPMDLNTVPRSGPPRVKDLPPISTSGDVAYPQVSKN